MGGVFQGVNSTCSPNPCTGATASIDVTVELSPLIVAGRAVNDFWLSPDGTRAVYLADQNVNEQFELFSVQVRNRE